MLESVFLAVFVFGIALNVVGWLIMHKIFIFVSMMTWISMIATNSLSIQVPGDTTYTEFGLNAFAWLFVFVDIIYLIAIYIMGRPRDNSVGPYIPPGR